MKKRLFILLFGIFLINLVSASYSVEGNYTIYPFYNSYGNALLGVTNNTNTLIIEKCTGLCFTSKTAIMSFNSSNGSYLIPFGSKFGSIFFNFTVIGSTSGDAYISSTGGYNITNDGSFITNLSAGNLGLVNYANQSGLTTKSYQISLGKSGLEDFNNRSINNTFGIILPTTLLSDGDDYTINSTNASSGRPFIIVQKTCQPTGISIWIIPTETICTVLNENIDVRNYGYRIDGTLILINSTLIRNKADPMFYTGSGIKLNMQGNASRIVYN